MLKEKSVKLSIIYILIFLFCFSLAACSGTGKIKTSPEPALIGGESSEQNPKNVLPIINCPKEPTRYLITFFHKEFLDLDPGTGDTIQMTFESTPPGEIKVWIDEKGNITPAEENENIIVTVSGEARYPDSKSCPVQKLTGMWELSTILAGDCISGKVEIGIQHLYETAYLESSCGELPPMIQQFVSAPEETLKFDLADSIPSFIIDYGEGTFYHVIHSYYFTRDVSFWELPTPASE